MSVVKLCPSCFKVHDWSVLCGKEAEGDESADVYDASTPILIPVNSGTEQSDDIYGIEPSNGGPEKVSRNLNKRNRPWRDKDYIARGLPIPRAPRVSLDLEYRKGILVPKWSASYMAVHSVARFYVGCSPWELKPGTKKEIKYWTMLAEIKVKWFSGDDPLAHAKELFLHGSYPVCEHTPKVVDLEPFADFPDRGLCKKCADRLNVRIATDMKRIRQAAEECARWESENLSCTPEEQANLATMEEIYQDFPGVRANHAAQQQAYIELMQGKSAFLIPSR